MSQQSCAFRDHAGELGELGAQVAGPSAQPLVEQIEFAEREQMPPDRNAEDVIRWLKER